MPLVRSGGGRVARLRRHPARRRPQPKAVASTDRCWRQQRRRRAHVNRRWKHSGSRPDCHCCRPRRTPTGRSASPIAVQRGPRASSWRPPHRRTLPARDGYVVSNPQAPSAPRACRPAEESRSQRVPPRTATTRRFQAVTARVRPASDRSAIGRVPRIEWLTNSRAIVCQNAC